MIELCGVSKIYKRGKNEVCALNDLSLKIQKGELCAITGSSGSGKSTLLNIIGCLDVPTRGDYYLGGVRVDKKLMNKLRRDMIGFVFQSFDLIPNMTALENTELPMLISGMSRAERRIRAEKALDAVGLGLRRDHLPRELSGGQKQRVAIARALVKEPEILLADEPCGNLDPKSSGEIMNILKNCGKTLILITHDLKAAAQMPRVIKIENGEM